MKVCDCPGVLFFDRAPQRGFHDVVRGLAGGWRRDVARQPGRDHSADVPEVDQGGRHEGSRWAGVGVGDIDAGRQQRSAAQIADWQDSLIQAIEIAYVLGFRRLLLAGAELQIPPEAAHLDLARARGVDFRPGELLQDFYRRCRQAGLTQQQLESSAGVLRPYHFDETKSLAAAIQTDGHYFRVVQYLRLSRKALALAGLELISATPGSRLNSFFPCRSTRELADELLLQIGDPSRESTRGKYAEATPKAPLECGRMRDVRPHHWPAATKKPAGGTDVRRAVEPKPSAVGQGVIEPRDAGRRTEAVSTACLPAAASGESAAVLPDGHAVDVRAAAQRRMRTAVEPLVEIEIPLAELG
jgi:hypothetical protein